MLVLHETDKQKTELVLGLQMTRGLIVCIRSGGPLQRGEVGGILHLGDVSAMQCLQISHALGAALPLLRTTHLWWPSIFKVNWVRLGLPRWLCDCQCRRWGFDPWVRQVPWRRKWQPAPVFLPWEIPWTEEPGGLQSMGSQRVRYHWARTRNEWVLLTSSSKHWTSIILVSHELFQGIHTEGVFPNAFRRASVMLMPKPDKSSVRTKSYRLKSPIKKTWKSYTQYQQAQSFLYVCHDMLHNISWQMLIYARNTEVVYWQHKKNL